MDALTSRYVINVTRWADKHKERKTHYFRVELPMYSSEGTTLRELVDAFQRMPAVADVTVTEWAISGKNIDPSEAR